MDLAYLRNINNNLNSTAIISGSKQVSYKEFFNEISRYSEFLQSIGVRENNHCAILSDNSVEYVYLLFAIWNCGAIAVPLNVRLLGKDILNQLLHSETKFVFVSEKHSKFVPDENSNFKKYIFPFKKNYGLVSFRPQTKIVLENTALIIYTSGTTSSPKGVMLSFANLISSSETAEKLLRFTPGDRWLASLPFYHVGGLLILVRSFLNSTSVIIPKSLSFEQLITSIKKQKPALASLVPTVLKRMIENNVKPNPELKYLLLGGGPSETKLVTDAVSLGWNIVKVYGSTETASMVTGFPVKERLDKINSSGLALAGNSIRIEDENHNTLPPGTSGEIVVSGNSILQGYWQNEKETKSKLIYNAFYTGDVGYIDEDGFLFVNNRISDLIISGGENINPDEVEEVLIILPGIKEASVFALPDDEWGQIPAAAIVKDEVLSETEILIFLKESLASYKIPKKIFFVNELPRNSMGKVIKEGILRNMGK